MIRKVDTDLRVYVDWDTRRWDRLFYYNSWGDTTDGMVPGHPKGKEDFVMGGWVGNINTR